MRGTERDRWLLETVGKLRFATTSQLTRLHFTSRWGANKRLRKLLDAGLVRAWVRSLSEENVYSLDRRGVRLLEKDHSGDGWFVPRGLDRNLDHLLAINQVRVSLAVCLPRTGGEIVWWRSDWELRTGVRGRVVPDAVFEVRWDRDSGVFALEVENGGRSPRRFLQKILAYSTAASGGGVLGFANLVVLVVCRHPREVERYREIIASTAGRVPVGLALLEDVDTRGEGIWIEGRGGKPCSLRVLRALSYRKERVGYEIANTAEG